MNVPTQSSASGASTMECIRTELQRQFQPDYLDIVDDGAKHIGHAHEGSGHFTVTITARAFSGQSRLQRHRMVFNALEKLLAGEIHALSIKAHAPEDAVSV